MNNRILNIAESIADLYEKEILRLDIQYSDITNTPIGHLTIGDRVNLTVTHKFKIYASGNFREVDE